MPMQTINHVHISLEQLRRYRLARARLGTIQPDKSPEDQIRDLIGQLIPLACGMNADDEQREYATACARRESKEAMLARVFEKVEQFTTMRADCRTALTAGTDRVWIKTTHLGNYLVISTIKDNVLRALTPTQRRSLFHKIQTDRQEAARRRAEQELTPLQPDAAGRVTFALSLDTEAAYDFPMVDALLRSALAGPGQPMMRPLTRESLPSSAQWSVWPKREAIKQGNKVWLGCVNVCGDTLRHLRDEHRQHEKMARDLEVLRMLQEAKKHVSKGRTVFLSCLTRSSGELAGGHYALFGFQPTKDGVIPIFLNSVTPQEEDSAWRIVREKACQAGINLVDESRWIRKKLMGQHTNLGCGPAHVEIVRNAMSAGVSDYASLDSPNLTAEREIEIRRNHLACLLAPGQPQPAEGDLPMLHFTCGHVQIAPPVGVMAAAHDAEAAFELSLPFPFGDIHYPLRNRDKGPILEQLPAIDLLDFNEVLDLFRRLTDKKSAVYKAVCVERGAFFSGFGSTKTRNKLLDRMKSRMVTLLCEMGTASQTLARDDYEKMRALLSTHRDRFHGIGSAAAGKKLSEAADNCGEITIRYAEGEAGESTITFTVSKESEENTQIGSVPSYRSLRR